MMPAQSGRVLLDVHQLGMRHTGNETWARNVVAALERRGESLHYALPDIAELPPAARARGHAVSQSSTRRLLVDLPRVARNLRPSAIAAQYTLPLTRVPGVVVVHDVSFEDPRAPQWLSRTEILRYRATIRASVRRARVVLVSSEHTRTDLLRYYRVRPERVRVALCAVDEGLVALLADARGAVSVPAPYVLVVGNLLRRKNVAVVARAIAHLRMKGREVTMRLVGKQPASGAQALAELKALLGDGLEATGHVDQSELAHQYAGAAVVAYPSLYEGFGLPILEAMAAGVPVVASRASCLPEVAGDAAVLVEPLDVLAWGNAIATLLDYPEERKRVVGLGDARVQAFSWDHTADVLVTALMDAADG